MKEDTSNWEYRDVVYYNEVDERDVLRMEKEGWEYAFEHRRNPSDYHNKPYTEITVIFRRRIEDWYENH